MTLKSKKSKIIMKGETEFVDLEARKQIMNMWEKLNTRIDTINKRTKDHTIQLRKLKKEVKLNG